MPTRAHETSLKQFMAGSLAGNIEKIVKQDCAIIDEI
jgi:hypothetical protein